MFFSPIYYPTSSISVGKSIKKAMLNPTSHKEFPNTVQKVSYMMIHELWGIRS